MSKKLKLISLIVFGAAVISILVLYNLDLFIAGEEENAGSQEADEFGDTELIEDIDDFKAAVEIEEVEEDVESNDPENLESAEFTPTTDPYRVYNEARENSKPIVLEFYADT